MTLQDLLNEYTKAPEEFLEFYNTIKDLSSKEIKEKTINFLNNLDDKKKKNAKDFLRRRMKNDFPKEWKVIQEKTTKSGKLDFVVSIEKLSDNEKVKKIIKYLNNLRKTDRDKVKNAKAVIRKNYPDVNWKEVDKTVNIPGGTRNTPNVLFANSIEKLSKDKKEEKILEYLKNIVEEEKRKTAKKYFNKRFININLETSSTEAAKKEEKVASLTSKKQTSKMTNTGISSYTNKNRNEIFKNLLQTEYTDKDVYEATKKLIDNTNFLKDDIEFNKGQNQKVRVEVKAVGKTLNKKIFNLYNIKYSLFLSSNKGSEEILKLIKNNSDYERKIRFYLNKKIKEQLKNSTKRYRLAISGKNDYVFMINLAEELKDTEFYLDKDFKSLRICVFVNIKNISSHNIINPEKIEKIKEIIKDNK